MTNWVLALLTPAILAAVLPAAPASAAGPARSTPAIDIRESHPEILSLSGDTLSLFRKSEPILSSLDSIFREAGARNDSTLLLAALLSQGRALQILRRSAAAEPKLRAAMDLSAALRDTFAYATALRFHGVSLRLLGRLDEATDHFRRLLRLALDRADPELEAYARLGLAYGDGLRGATGEAVEGYESARKIFRQTGNPLFEMTALSGIGRCHMRRNENEAARNCFLEVIHVCDRIGEVFLKADALNNLGSIAFFSGDPGAAAAYSRQARDLYRENGNVPASLTPARNVAVMQTYMGLHDEAAASLEEALRICDEEANIPARVVILLQLATVRRMQGRLAEAAATYRRSIAAAESTSVRDRAEGLVGLAQTLSRRDSAQAALAVLQERLEPLRDRLVPPLDFYLDGETGNTQFQLGRYQEALAHLRRADQAGVASGLGGTRLYVLALTARCYRELARPDSALAVLQRAARFWETNRWRSGDPQWREQLSADARYLYVDLAELLLSYPPDRPEGERRREAFDTLQRFKARTLRERMTGPDPRPADPTTPSTLDSAAVESGAVTLRDLQTRLLRDREVLLDAFVGERGSLVFAVTRSECQVARLPEPDSLFEARIRRYRDLNAGPIRGPVSGETLELLDSTARAMGEALLGGVADLIRRQERIIFVPDGPLNLLPLETLRLPDPEDSSPEPLLATHEIVRVPSATVLAQLRDRTPAPDSAGRFARALALAGGSGKGGGMLPGAKEEVRWLRRSFRGVDPWPRTWSDSILGRYQVLHLATHILADNLHPWQSAILVPDRDSTVALRADHITTMRLPARLVVLAGCGSAGGRVLSGEGVLGLTGAFLAAGVPAVIASLWPVSDRVSAELVKEFYEALADGKTTAAALKRAQSTIRANPRTRHPFYWSGFIVVGDGDVRVALRRRAHGFPVAVVAIAVALAGAGMVAWLRFQAAGRNRSDRVLHS